MHGLLVRSGLQVPGKATPDALSAFGFRCHHVRQAHEIGDFQLFGARLRVDAGGAHGVLVADVAQRVAQGLAALAEGGAADGGEALSSEESPVGKACVRTGSYRWSREL